MGWRLEDPGLGQALVDNGYAPDAPSPITCEGVVVYLDQHVCEALLRELRSVATVGTRLALSLSTSLTSADQPARRERFQAAVRAVGEPARNTLTYEATNLLLTTTGWQPVEMGSVAARHLGFVVAAPA